ncbi:DUF1569 domain-containing protein [uncultured Polaribacter sp.]|uniref:DUF1569 domain-containing protein n=1 Tax=uncultured Polaribacter sp. TaxID=174711 RepID=UPI00262AA0E1|nr:DUF1569 domain-containing protein [uncultured Polaribacter sp.]
MKNIFELEVSSEIIDRINLLTPATKSLWGKMNVSQMLAHCNVTYEMVYTEKHPKPNFVMKLILKTFVKKIVVGEKEYSKNGKTAPQFLISDEREFEKEKKNLIDYIKKTQKLGATYFDQKESHSFGKLNKKEWNNMFYKHLDHHLSQFGV